MSGTTSWMRAALIRWTRAAAEAYAGGYLTFGQTFADPPQVPVRETPNCEVIETAGPAGT